MTLNEYQNHAMRTAADAGIAVLALGVAGESGEVADLIKKHIGHGHPLDREKVVKEIGDVLWYIATLAHRVGATLDEVAGANVAKLRLRYPDGFSSERSMQRVEGDR